MVYGIQTSTGSKPLYGIQTYVPLRGFLQNERLPEFCVGRSWGEEGVSSTNVELGVVVRAMSSSAVDELRARFPIQLAPDAAFGTTAAARKYVIARGPTNGDNSLGGLQMVWRMRCTDRSWLDDWRKHLNGWWNLSWPVAMCNAGRAVPSTCRCGQR